MNLPNVMTVSRIVAAPLIAALVLLPVWQLRLVGWVLYTGAAITDYYDGKLARSRNLVTDLGRLLDPLADKLLLLATMIPMYRLMGGIGLLDPRSAPWIGGAAPGPVAVAGGGVAYPFVTPVGLVGLPLWVALVVLGRELTMTVIRRAAARRGVIISASRAAKWKTGFQLVWAGAAYFWFFAAEAAVRYRWDTTAWRAFALLNGVVGAVTMAGAVALTLVSLALYVQRFGGVLRRAPHAPAAGAGDRQRSA